MAGSKKTSTSDQAGCNCITDPFAELPPEARPGSKARLGKLRQVTCPGCRLKYWTNRPIDLCKDCQKKDTRTTQ